MANIKNVKMLRNIFRTLSASSGFAGAAYAMLCGIKDEVIAKVYDAQIWLKRLAFINLTLIVLTMAMIYWRKENLAIFATAASALALIITWYIGNASAKMLATVEKSAVKAVAAELDKLIRPLLTVAVAIAFIGVWVVVCGMNSMDTRTFKVILTSVVFFTAFVVYTGSSTKLAGYLLAGMVCILLITYAFPDQTSAFRRSISSKSEKAMAEDHRASYNNQADARVTFAIVTRESQPYLISGFKYKDTVYDTLKPGHKVMVLKIKNDFAQEGDADWFGEPMARIMMTDRNGNFVRGNEEFYFPVSALSRFKVVSDFRQIRMPEQYKRYMGTGGFFTKEVEPVSNGQPEVIARVYNGSEFIYSSEGEFAVVENPGTNQAKIGENRPKCEPGKEKSFMFINQPPEGSVIALMPVNSSSSFKVRYKIKM